MSEVEGYGRGIATAWLLCGPEPRERHKCAVPAANPFRELSEQRGNLLRLHQLARLVEVIVNDRFRIDPDRVIDGREQFRRVHRVDFRARARGVTLALDI